MTTSFSFPLSDPWAHETSNRLEDLFDAWTFAAYDATEALHAWLGASPRDRGGAFAAYRAALEREEHAACVLESVALTPA